MTGRLIGVVGPSGVGKDSVMAGLVEEDPQLGLVRRTITREPELGGEDYTPATQAAFDRLVDAGAFCLHWQAHGLSYGIPAEVRDQVGQGAHLLVNLSRRVLNEAETVVPRFEVLNITAAPETLARRLAQRGRETPDDIRARLARSVDLPRGLTIHIVANDGPLSKTIATALALLKPERVHP
ncbi:MAG: phosphonate metabolism protein/1,5-bisphosphokinase (PRPP-forming) PhnN [Pseudomonadota bacterium]